MASFYAFDNSIERQETFEINRLIFLEHCWMEYLSEHRKKLIDKNLNEQLQKHTELLVINSELIQQTGSSSKKIQLTELLRKINNLYLERDQ